MLEEFHALRNADNVVTAYKQLYGWNSLNPSVWIPSMSELVGYTGTAHPTTGVYKSAMQGLNTSTNYWTDPKGGAQFAYFQQYNASGGGEALMAACNQQASWLRSPDYAQTRIVLTYASAGGIGWAPDLVVSLAVHPAVLDKKINT